MLGQTSEYLACGCRSPFAIGGMFVDGQSGLSAGKVTGNCVTTTFKPKTIDLSPDIIQNRKLVVAIEAGGSQAQLAQVERAVGYANARGLVVQIVLVKGKAK